MKKGNVNNGTIAEFFRQFFLSFRLLDYFTPCASVAQLNSILALQTHLKVWWCLGLWCLQSKLLLSSVTN